MSKVRTRAWLPISLCVVWQCDYLSQPKKQSQAMPNAANTMPIRLQSSSIGNQAILPAGDNGSALIQRQGRRYVDGGRKLVAQNHRN